MPASTLSVGVSRSSVSRRFVARTKAQVTTHRAHLGPIPRLRAVASIGPRERRPDTRAAIVAGLPRAAIVASHPIEDEKVRPISR